MWNILLRSWNWCTRFKYRCGYGVHSPSDFYLITFVAYESLPYYAYSTLHKKRRSLLNFPHYREKIDKLLFRLINHFQPKHVWEFGTGSGLESLYIEAACHIPVLTWSEHLLSVEVKDALSECLHIHCETGNVEDILMQWNKKFGSPEVVHLAHTSHYEKIFEFLLPLMKPSSCLIIGLPYASEEKKRWWRKVIADPRVGVTFDFYDLGLIFFDFKRVKEHRIVNFL